MTWGSLGRGLGIHVFKELSRWPSLSPWLGTTKGKYSLDVHGRVQAKKKQVWRDLPVGNGGRRSIPEGKALCQPTAPVFPPPTQNTGDREWGEEVMAGYQVWVNEVYALAVVTLECMLHKWMCPDPALLYPDGGRGCHKCVAFVCRSLQLETFPHPHIAFPPGVPPSRSGPADARKRAWFRLVVFLFFLICKGWQWGRATEAFSLHDCDTSERLGCGVLFSFQFSLGNHPHLWQPFRMEHVFYTEQAFPTVQRRRREAAGFFSSLIAFGTICREVDFSSKNFYFFPSYNNSK